MSTSRFAHLCRSRPAAPFSLLPSSLYLYVAEPLSFIRMSPLLIKISKDFAMLFTTINPIATLALFAGLTASLSPADRHWTALRATIDASCIGRNPGHRKVRRKKDEL